MLSIYNADDLCFMHADESTRSRFERRVKVITSRSASLGETSTDDDEPQSSVSGKSARSAPALVILQHVGR